jgi:uncharacterized membrane protein YesL
MVWNSVMIAAGLYWRRLGILVTANLLWLLLSLPSVTWPAATAGLFSLVRQVVREELGEASRDAQLSDFWAGFRQHGLRGTLLTLLDLAGLTAIVVVLAFYLQSPAEPLRWLSGPIAMIGIVWLMAQIYLYPLLIQRTESNPLEVLREALLTALRYPLSSLSLLLTSIVVAVPAVILAGPVLIVLFSAMATLQTVALRQVLALHGEVGEVTP